jgi:hypothetical protein
MAGHQIGLGQADVAADHVERRVAQDLLEAERVAAVDEVAACERVVKSRGLSPGPLSFGQMRGSAVVSLSSGPTLESSHARSCRSRS